MTETKLIYSPDELIALGFGGRTTVYNLLKSGKLRSVRVGRKICVPTAAVEAFLAGESAPTKTNGLSKP